MSSEKLTVRSWLSANVDKYSDRHLLFEDCARALEVGMRQVQRIYKKQYVDPVSRLSGNADDVLSEASHDSRHLKQLLSDFNRIDNSKIRSDLRLENALTRLESNISAIFEENPITFPVYPDIQDSSSKLGIVHISDVHFNSIVDIPGNKYNMEIASIRLRAFAEKLIPHFRVNGITDVLIAMTGDLMNSDRRLDELLTLADSRASSVFVAAEILSQFISHLRQHFSIRVAHVVGNESRIQKDVGWTSKIISDNYDTVLFNILRMTFRDVEDIHFIVGDPRELVLSFHGKNILMFHGHGSCVDKDPVRSVERIRGRYSAKGMTIDFAMFGHIHSAYIGEFFGRSGGLIGGNTYSEFDLGCTSRASQNVYIMSDNGCVDGLKFDLQISEGSGYPFHSFSDPLIEVPDDVIHVVTID